MDLFKNAALVLCLVMLGGCRLTVSVDGEGTVTSDNGKINCPSDCKAKLKRGKDITLTATASEGSFFASWSGCDEESGNECVMVGRNKNRRVTAVFSQDITLDESDLSEDLKNCATEENNVALTALLSSITKLECDATRVGSDAFDVSGIDLLANVTTLVIVDGGRGMTSLEDIGAMPKLGTLKLTAMGLEDVFDELEDLNSERLITLNLNGNPLAICDDVRELRAQFLLDGSTATVVADDCL